MASSQQLIFQPINPLEISFSRDKSDVFITISPEKKPNDKTQCAKKSLILIEEMETDVKLPSKTQWNNSLSYSTQKIQKRDMVIPSITSQNRYKEITRKLELDSPVKKPSLYDRKIEQKYHSTIKKSRDFNKTEIKLPISKRTSSYVFNNYMSPNEEIKKLDSLLTKINIQLQNSSKYLHRYNGK